MNIQSGNLYQLFSSLTDNELKELGKAVHSPFFNYRDEEVRLFEYLLLAKKAKRALTADDICKYVFREKKTDLAKLRHVMTYLTRIITRYLTIRQLDEDEEQKHLLLTQTLRRRNLTKQFLANYNEANDYLDNSSALSANTYYYQLQLHTEYYTYSIVNRTAKPEDMQRLADDLDLFYVVQKLKQACNILSYKNIFKYDEEAVLMSETLALIKRRNMFSNPLVNLLYVNYLCLNQPDNEAHFIQLKAALLNNSDRVDVKELRDIYTLAINYCIKRLNTGKQQYYQHIFEIYQSGLTRKVFEENGKLSPFTYKNIAAIAIGLKEYKWVADFMETYKERLDKEIRAGFYAYCMARYYFAKADYNKVTDLLQEVEIKEQFTELDTRVLLIKTYYELSEYNLLDYSNGNLKQQLKRKNLQSYHQEVYKTFAKMVGQLTHLRPYDKKAKALFIDKVTKAKAIAEREWLLSKVK